MLGWEFTEKLSALYGSDAILSLGRKELDISLLSSVEKTLSSHRPATVINCAAYTNVDGAETEREVAEKVNAIGPRNLAQICTEFGIKLIHFSTDQVFDGKSDHPRTEEETPHPLNYYAQTKLEGERAVLECPSSLVLRVQWLYGQKKDRFTRLRDLTEFNAFSDQFGAPTWTREIVTSVLRLIDENHTGLFHFAYDDAASWFDVFSFVKDEMGWPVALNPSRTTDLGLPAKRPLFSVLSNKKLCSTLGIASMGSWKKPLREFLQLNS
jgi:dTDP-4-dehydrorhamnose reductase